MSRPTSVAIPKALRFTLDRLVGFVLRNLNLMAFSIGLMMILLLDREALAPAYLALGFAWLMTWLVAGQHQGTRPARRRVLLTETRTLGGTLGGTLEGSVTMLD
ncbi:hypothetical protein TRM7557_01287 [Tritonibacter multivorans]|uniref:Uncharacterized protein n=1 Tax=Tritonibacter multivorans TaxID=928856 RepID=A0A0P1GPV3_9RHOB|nr:hypothetical protein [Tritonibacter multivorans]MDA7422697.1 hypothetical protein [Tritonibacter multivorans]CUH77255.1 hypothetical protein TRM7557_01287 [Tritonibacter multivorans]SFD53239.1 hypothetical protein SAMN04488049_11581 [Tritonibacter multivorans]